MGNVTSGEEAEVGFTIERNTVRNERDLVSQKGKLTAKEEERLNAKREQLRVMREQNKALTLRTRQRLEMSQKLTQEFKARVVITEDDDGHHKGMLRKHARPNLFSLSPQKKKEYMSAVKIQSVWRGHKVRKIYGKMAKRTTVAKELLATEKDYIHFLTALVTVYYLPLKSRAESDIPLLTLEEVRTIFPQLEMILLYNQQLYDVLDERIRCKWNADTTIGDAFLALIDFLKPPYTHYISHFPLISQQIKDVSKRFRVAMFFQECKALPECGGLDLTALASMPFQRIPRYILLLKEVVANTHESHPDHVFLKEAIAKMDVLAKTANEKLREQETARSIMDIQRRLDPPIGNLMKPHRKLVREGAMRYKLNHSTRRLLPGFHNGVIFLFTDCLLITEPITISMTKLFESGGQPKLRPIEVLSLNNSAVLDIMEDYKERNAKCFDFRVHSLQATVYFEVDAMGLKEAWVNDIAGAINALTENAISYKSKAKRKSRAYSSINRRSSSVRIPSKIIAHAFIEEDVHDHPLSTTPPSPVQSRHPNARPPLTIPEEPSPSPSPSPSAGRPAHAFAIPTSPALSHSPVVRNSVNPSSPVLTSFSSFLSHQRYTVNLSSENLTKEYPINVNQTRALYIDNSPPQEEILEKRKREEERKKEEERRKEEERMKAEEKAKWAEEKKGREKEKEERERGERKKKTRKQTGESRKKKHMSVYDIVNIILANNDFKDFDEEDEEDYEEREEEGEEEERSYNNSNNNNATFGMSDSTGQFEMSDSMGPFETYDEMAVRITNSLGQRNFLGITRTNSENQLSLWRHSANFASTLPRSSSFSTLDGILIGAWGT